jgi:hypothetical protein
VNPRRASLTAGSCRARVDIDELAYETLPKGTPEPVVIRDRSLRGAGIYDLSPLQGLAVSIRLAGPFLFFCLLLTTAIPSQGREKDVLAYGEGLIINIPLPESEVAEAVEEAAQNTIIRGTKEYNKDEYVAGAISAISTPVFPKWTDSGKVFYKVRNHALDPRNFKDGSDVGTLAVRYVVKPQGEKNTVLRIDAIFVEDFRRVAHLSNGSVESAEYKDILDRLASIELVKKETDEALRAKREHVAKKASSTDSEVSSSNDLSSSKNTDNDNDNNKDKGNEFKNNDGERELLSTPPSASTSGDSMVGQSPAGEKTAAQSATAPPSQSSATSPAPSGYEESAESLQQHLAELRRQVERLVMKPGAPLKSAPFHSASTLKSLEPGVEVLILISTTYWYGVETRDGEHGWIRRDQLEQLP